jgi:putative Mg2+ transporter-C (MgtC) family protein
MIPLPEIILRLSFAALLGALIGLERDLRRRPAGLRTSLFVCLATALFTILSGQIAHLWGDTASTRIASNIVQGVGFLGAGAILRESGSVVGMTTAATIFVEAAIGMAAGAGFYVIAGYTVALALFGLTGLGLLERKLHLKPRIVVFRITTSHTENVASEVQQLLTKLHIAIEHFRVFMTGTNSVVEFDGDVGQREQEQIVSHFNRPGVTTEVIPLLSHRESL